MKLNGVFILTLLVVLFGCEGGGGSGKTSQAPVREKSPLVLEAASLEHGAELTWNQEQFPGAVFNVCIAEEQPNTNAQDCFFHKDAMIEDDHASPVTISGLSGGHRYWVQIEAVMPSGAAFLSWPVIVTARIPDDQLLGTDTYDWRKDPELEAEKQAIAQQVLGFQQAATNKNISAAAALIAETQRDVYQALFTNNPAAMPAFGALLDRARISFLSPPTDPEAESSLRTAEYELELDGFTFYVRWMKVDDTWMLMDF
jgi:hypothetical protein